MKFSIGLTLMAAAIAVGLVILTGGVLLRPPSELITQAAFDLTTITPNADGQQDITTFRYTVTRNASVSLTFTDADGRTFTFRQNEPRIGGDYTVAFSGVVDGYTLPDEPMSNRVERRLLPNGDYTWTLQATTDTGNAQRSGTFSVLQADTPLPIISIFTVGPSVFSPNQDGIADRVAIEVYLEKEADLRVFLQAADGTEVPISARKEGRREGEAGRHLFDYEGGIDLGADPPSDGTYQVIAVAQDAEGQRVSTQSTLTIESGGKPLAEIAPQFIGVDVVLDAQPYEERFFSSANQSGDLVSPPNDPQDLTLTAITMPIGDMLVFRLTVNNYNDVPIRTTNPPPGTVYQQEQSSASLGMFESPGAWRVGIQCETSAASFPYRWALGSKDDLLMIPDPQNGTPYYYVPPNTQVVVWGAVRFTKIQQRQNPQTCWAGLIQEDVEVSLRNSFVGAREIELVDPNANNSTGG